MRLISWTLQSGSEQVQFYMERCVDGWYGVARSGSLKLYGGGVRWWVAMVQHGEGCGGEL